MKKRILGVVLAVLFTGVSFAQDYPISERELPAQVRNSVTKHFGKKSIASVVKDVDRTKTTYEVYFSDQTKAEFRSNGELKEAKNYNGLPNTAVPAKIQAYVKKNYPNAVVTEYEKNTYKQEVKLSNGLDLEFSLDGRFLRIDD